MATAQNRRSFFRLAGAASACGVLAVGAPGAAGRRVTAAAAPSPVGPSPDQTQAPPGSSAFPVPEVVIREAMARAQAPGIALGILHDGAEYAAGFGVTSVESPLPVDADTLCQIGSVTKTFTTTAALRLVEEGRLDLDLPIRTYLPDFHLADEDAAARVTLRNLLTHSGGWADVIRDTGDSDGALARYVAGLTDVPQLFPLGADHWSYSNSAFIVAGRVIEVATGKTYENALQELVFAPLGMDRTFFRPADVITYRFTVGHLPGPSGIQVARQWALGRAARPAGGIVTSARQMLRYARFHLGDGTTEDGRRLLSAGSMRAMRTPQVPSGSLGLTWNLTQGIVSHGGATFGQVATLQLLPERGIAFIGMANIRDDQEGDAIFQSISQWAFNHFGIETPEPTPLPRTAEALAPYVGTYDAAMFQVAVTVEGTRMFLHVTSKGPTQNNAPAEEMEAAFIGDNEVMVLDGRRRGARADFVVEDGEVRWLRWFRRLARRIA